jgi:hypothetical protein
VGEKDRLAGGIGELLDTSGDVSPINVNSNLPPLTERKVQ